MRDSHFILTIANKFRKIGQEAVKRDPKEELYYKILEHYGVDKLPDEAMWSVKYMIDEIDFTIKSAETEMAPPPTEHEELNLTDPRLPPDPRVPKFD